MGGSLFHFNGNETGVLALILGFPIYFFISIILGLCSELLKINFSSFRYFISKKRRIITSLITLYLFLLITTELGNNNYSLFVIDVIVFPILLLIAVVSVILGIKLGRKIANALKS